MSRDELERDIAEENEVRGLLRERDRRLVVPPFSAVEERAARGHPLRTAAALSGALLLLVAAVVAARALPKPAEPASPSASPAAVAPSACPAPGAAALAGPRQHGRWLLASLEAIEPTDRQTNQLHWVIRFTVPRDAPGPAGVSVGVSIEAGPEIPGTARRRHMLHVLGYELRDVPGQPVREGEQLRIEPCGSLALVVRTAGPLSDGVFPYTVRVEKVALPEGRTEPATVEVTLACSNRTFSCARADPSATATPGATAVPGVLAPDFAVIYDGVRTGLEKGSAPQVRREGETRAVGELAPSFFNQFNGAVSPDGRRAVYFATGAGSWALYLLDGARPNEQRRLAEIRGEIPGGRPVWSGDGSGVAFTVLDESANQGVRPTYSALRTIEIATGEVRELARAPAGSAYAAVGWDRARSIIAATLHPHGQQTGTTYVAISSSGTRTWAMDAGYSIAASPRTHEVAGVRCEAARGCSLWLWPLGDFGSRRDLRVTASSLGLLGWRPGADEVALMVGSSDPGKPGDIELVSSSGARRVAYPLTTLSERPFFRADGRALIVPLRLDEAIVVDLASGLVSPLPLPAPLVPWELGRLAASIRLR